MANYETLKSAIQQVVKTNGNNKITGALLQQSLLAMINSLGSTYQMGGLATPTGAPGTPDYNVAFLALTPGTYPNYGELVLNPDEYGLFLYNGSWSKQTMQTVQGNTKYLLTLDTLGNNVFDANYIRNGKIVRTSSPYDIFDFAGAVVTGFYRVPSTCKKITTSGIVTSGTAYMRLSKAPTDDSESIAYNINTTINITDANKDYPYLCVTVYRGTSGSTPNLSNVKITFGDVSQIVDDTANEIKHLHKQFQNNVWKTYGDESILDNPIIGHSNYTRRQYYDCIRSIKFFGCDKTVPRTLMLAWNKAATTGDNLRISRYNASTNAWVTEFVYNGILSTGITTNGVASITINGDVSGDTNKKVELIIDLSQMPLLTAGGSYVLNPLTSTPEYVFSETCYFENVGALENDVAALKPSVKNLQMDTYKLKNGLVYGADLFTISGFINSADGNVKSHATLKCTDFIPVLPGQIYTTLLQMGGTSCVGFYDADKVYIGYWNTTSGSVGTMTIPDNAYYMRLSNRNIEAPYAKLNNPPFVGVVGLSEIVKDITTLPFNTPTRLYPQTKLPCISIQFDDCNVEGDAQVVNLFDGYNAKCGFAFVASESNIAKRGARYLAYQRKGYTILSHSINGTVFNTTNYTYATALAAIMQAKNNLEKAGFIVNGFVSPSSAMAAEFMPILKATNAYAFTSITNRATTNGRNQDTCDLHRYSMESHTTAEIEQFIDDCIANDQFITLYGHTANFGTMGADMWDISKVQTILEYIIAKRDAGLVWFGNTDDCAKYFFGL